MNAEAIKECDQILGYTLTRKIGSGGYGDVWEADAPGGLKKAIKIIYGYHDEKRAQSELKALGRIKEARHPFLLSLERIEIFSSKLIVISELADKSLADLANEYHRRQETGIPRDELIGYMRDSADALDYLNSTFGLQHLDIKPENILLVSGHAKVADFGLVKDLQETHQSLMSGMTPAYAAVPELFDGRPGAASDQYSLATVYQEMLTLIRPFSGTTPAQLAAQHMHGKPDLRPLPISDQSVVAKALSKDPGDRYKTCSQFVSQLSNRKTRKKVIKSRVTVRQTTDTACNTEVFDVTSDSNFATELFTDSRLTFKSVELESLDPPECEPEAAVFQPTIVIGVGKSSSTVVQKIRQRMVARHGSMEAIPALNLLCIDSDRDSLARLSQGRKESSVTVGETLAVPLRRSEQYRQHKKLDLSWISRRWIYNVPRSLQTDGLRPLGRLVFADHFSAICDKISDCIRRVVKPEYLAKSCDTLELNPPDDVVPRVILVSNISGGIGSGMTNDLAYTIRLMLAENGLKDGEVIGMLMFGSQAGREVSLATANAYAYMCELRHFADGGYPGDGRLGISEFEDELPFDYTYGLKLSADQDKPGISDFDKIAEYICLSSTTPCSVFFDACRERDHQHDEFALRTFGISICGPGIQVQGHEAVESLSKGLIEYWISGSADDKFGAGGFAEACVNDFQLKLKDTTTTAIGIISDLDEWQEANEAIHSAPLRLMQNVSTLKFQDIASYFDGFLDVPHWRRQSLGETTNLCLSAESEISSEAQVIGDKLSTRILDLLNGDRVNFAKAKEALQSCCEVVASEHDNVIKGLHAFGSSMQQLSENYEQNKARSTEKADSNFVSRLIEDYGQVRSREFTMRCCNDYYRIIKSCLTSTEEIIKKFCMQIEMVGDGFEVQPPRRQSSRRKATIQELLLESVTVNRQSHIKQLEKLVLDSVIQEGTQFLEVLSDSMNWQKNLPATIRDSAQSVLSSAFKKISIDEVISRNQIQPSELKKWLNQQLTEAMPSVTNCGGGSTLMFGEPLKAGRSAVPKIVSDCFDVKLKEIRGTTGDLALCFEVERILLANFAFSILIEAPEATEIAKRIHTRDDIDWTTLADLM